jgi:hypothetical protein
MLRSYLVDALNKQRPAPLNFRVGSRALVESANRSLANEDSEN